MKKTVIVFILMLSNLLLAENLPSIKMKVSPPDKEGISGRVVLLLPRDFHLYGNGAKTGKPTRIKFAKGVNVRVLYPKGVALKDRESGQREYVYEKRVVFPFIIDGGVLPKTGSLEIELEGLMCGMSQCIPVEGKLTAKVLLKDKLPVVAQTVSCEVSSQLGQTTGGNFSLGTDLTKTGDNEEFRPVFLNREITGLMQAIFLGILAGFVLNFMPCVLPVVGLKVMSLIKQAGSDRRSVFIHSALFTAGVLTTFLLLASLAVFGGYQWGGLFQNSLFIVFMIFFIFFLSLSMFGLYTLNIPGFAASAAAKGGSGYSDSFIKGLLATLLATPCSGPFLGAVLAWSLLQGPALVFAVFISIGVGMALPYFILALKPGLLRFMPGPGMWMIKLERFMGLLLMGTVVYLAMVLPYRERLSAVVALFVITLALITGRRFLNSPMGRSRKIFGVLIIVLLFSSVYGISSTFFFTERAGQGSVHGAFSHEKLRKNSMSGKVSVVEFTADWCPNCRALEFSVFKSSEFTEVISNPAVEFMVADITEKGAPGESLLKKLGGRSIPFLAIFPSGKNFTKPLCIRDLYSTSDFKRAVERALELNGK